MSMYWAFDLETVAKHVIYLEKLVDTKTSGEVRHQIHTHLNHFYKDGKYVGPRPANQIQY